MLTKEEFVKICKEGKAEELWSAIASNYCQIPHDYELLRGEVTLLKEENEKLRLDAERHNRAYGILAHDYEVNKKVLSGTIEDNNRLREELYKTNQGVSAQHLEAVKQEFENAQKQRDWSRSREYWLRHYAGLAMQGIVMDPSCCAGGDIAAQWIRKQAENLCDELGIK